ncbi:MAG: hypothetical protein RLZZ324_75 [Candidatus Parcubacteria bacterium]|jgi:XTP/dITP diphosphohydrolase
MSTLSFVTSNPGKLPSVQRVLRQYGVVLVHRDEDLPELQADAPAEVARRKVCAAYDIVHGPVMVIDSGLCITALGGFPGTNVKHVTKQLGIKGYLKLLDGEADRSCTFIDALAYLDDALREGARKDVFVPALMIFVRSERGRIAEKPDGDPRGHKSPVATVFIPDGCDKTIAAMSADELAAYRSRKDTERFYHEFGTFLKSR